ncbi:MAG: DUF1697 domain-containing protein [Bacteroidetes bacterium]|nr:DUF1697 domain-containing protein [Bacteroidota bacterium]
MADLKAIYENLGFSNVTTYIQSGNVVFCSGASLTTSGFADVIEQQIISQYGFEVPVIVRTIREMVRTISRNPFLQMPEIDHEKLHVTFLAGLPLKSNVDKIISLDFSPDRFIIIENDVFLYCPVSYGNTKLSNKFFESKLKVTATTRNWATVKKLVEMG